MYNERQEIIKRLFNRLRKEDVMSQIKLPHDHGTKTGAFIENMPPRDRFEKTAETFSLISDPSRVKILWLLCHAEDCVTNIAAAVDMTSPAVSHHLRVLKQAGILSYRKEGKEAYYTLADTEEARMIHHIVDIIFDLNCKDCY